jgi:hypothetical protein
MFNSHNQQTQAYASASADNLADTITMVSLSIQQNWASVGTQLENVRAQGRQSKYLWGQKRLTYVQVHVNKDSIYHEFIKCRGNSEKLLKLFMGIHGLGLVKAGFVCQLAAGKVGCMDTHNIKRLHLKASALSVPKGISEPLKHKRISKYITLCENEVGTERLWDDWCNFVAVRHPKLWDTGEDVSQAHIDYLTGV